LITTQELFFCNAARLTDSYEGALPARNVEAIKQDLMKRLNLSESEAEERALREEVNVRRFKEFTLVNCWSMDREESYALWKIYLGGATSGVAVRTNVKHLTDAINKHSNSVDPIYMGEVKYADFINDHPNQYNVITRKRPYYKYERELRLFMLHQFDWDHTAPGGSNRTKVPRHPNGKRIRLDVTQLIDKIFVSPFSGEWFHNVLRTTVARINPDLAKRIVKSDIMDV
jgi:hypothetical protein